ncbi:hypothetical protein AYO44_00110 [Planctomycetaceae bacterium SCGC AG-212-F19]|nr:hypothetical protein AYO44_00110 [Planctomycetaceae bacterium SCGC AG-212-F19]
MDFPLPATPHETHLLEMKRISADDRDGSVSKMRKGERRGVSPTRAHSAQKKAAGDSHTGRSEEMDLP